MWMLKNLEGFNLAISNAIERKLACLRPQNMSERTFTIAVEP